MTNIVVGWLNHVRQLLKIVMYNKNRKIINYANQRITEIITTSTRELSSVTMMGEMIREENAVTNRFNKLKSYVNKYKLVYQRQVYSVIDLISTSRTITNRQLLSLLHWCSIMTDCLPLERVKMCQHLCLILALCDFKLNTTHYNAIITLYIVNKHDFSPVKLLKEMKSKGVYPDYVTYATCIDYYCDRGDINKALILIRCMKSLSFSTSQNIYNSLEKAYFLLGNEKALLDVMDDIQNESMQLTIKTYAALMCAYAKLNKIDEIKKLICLCNSRNIHVTNKNILNVIYTFAIHNTTNINTMYQYLERNDRISNSEVNIILKLIDINQINMAISALLHTCLHIGSSQFDCIANLILKQAIKKQQTVAEVIDLCSFLSNKQQVYKRYLMLSLYYSLMKRNDLFLALLKIYKCWVTVKPHFFWPLLFKKGTNFDLQGILDVLNIMVSDFNVSPCVDTIVDYVLPYTFGHLSNIRNLLMQHKVPDLVIDNAYLVYFLKIKKTKFAVAYMRCFGRIYYYKLIADHLRYVTIHCNDPESFTLISCNLVENIETSESCDKIRPVCMDKQMYDCIIHFPTHKIWLKKVMQQLVNKNIDLKSETKNMIEHLPKSVIQNVTYNQ